MKTTVETVGAIRRMTRAIGRQCHNPDDLAHFKVLRRELDAAQAAAIAGLRAAGETDTSIGAALGITRQAVQQRWPRTDRVTGAGARYAHSAHDG